MLATAYAQLRYAVALLANGRIRVEDIRRLAHDVGVTWRELGDLDEEELAQLRAASLDPQARAFADQRRLKKAARRAATTPYYRDAFARADLDPDDLELDRIADWPLTPKEHVKALPSAFVAPDAEPVLPVTTTGTTGHPTTIWYSRYELELATAVSAVGMMTGVGVTPHDVVLIALSSRATIGVEITLHASHLIGCVAFPWGLVPPDETLERLVTPMHVPDHVPQVSTLITYPSYLGQLVERARDLGIGPDDVGLERIRCGGEVLSSGLAQQAERAFGAVVADGYSMTETLPLAGEVCSHRHLHLGADQAYVEVLRPQDDAPAGAGEVGRLVVTPYQPYRETTLLFRFDTGDLVRVLDDQPLSCELANLPATSPILGKAALSLDGAARAVHQRDLLELLEADEGVILPARYAAITAAGELDLHVLVRPGRSDRAAKLERSAWERGLPIRRVVAHDDPDTLPPTSPLRCDLTETTFRHRRSQR